MGRAEYSVRTANGRAERRSEKEGAMFQRSPPVRSTVRVRPSGAGAEIAFGPLLSLGFPLALARSLIVLFYV